MYTTCKLQTGQSEASGRKGRLSILLLLPFSNLSTTHTPVFTILISPNESGSGFVFHCLLALTLDAYR